MTSTNINIGVNSDSRNSSRVLKPPGGGHSDIFGAYEVKEQQHHHVRYNQPKSTINEVFSFAKLDNNLTVINKTDHGLMPETAMVIPMEIATNGSNGMNGNGNENEVPKPTPQTPQRTRVPPGGFSSGLW